MAESNNTTKLTNLVVKKPTVYSSYHWLQVHKIMTLFSHLTSIDEIVIGTCINLNKIYHNQINQVW